MADEEKDPAEKTEDPSQYRIDEFRRKGQIASSKELTSVLMLAGIFFCLILSSAFMFDVIKDYFDWLYKFEISKVFERETILVIFKESIYTLLKMVAPIFVTSLCLGYITTVMQFGFLFSTEVLKWDLKKVDPISGVKRVFSKKMIFETFKGLLKFAIVIMLTYIVVKPLLKGFIGFLDSDLSVALDFTKSLFVKLVFTLLIGLLIMAIMDFAWEKYQYSIKLKMTKEEVKKEQKDKDGNPEIKQRIRTIQREMARKRMMNEVKEADVIVTNPTHISVAIKYDRENMHAPMVVAKGADHLALKIRELAKENKVPLVENVPLARAIYGTVKLGDFVPRNLYKAVAEILAYVYRKKLKKRNAA